MRNSTASAVTIWCATGVLAGVGHAQVHSWTNTLGGAWSSPANWNPPSVPDSPGESAQIAVGGSLDVVMDLSPSIDALTIANPGASVGHLAGQTVVLGAGGLVNNGVYALNPSGLVVLTQLRFGATSTINGTGTIRMLVEGPGSELAAALGVTVTNGASHTIRGQGRITAPLTNQGLVVAEDGRLVLSSTPKTNNALIVVGPTGALGIDGISITQGPLGLIRNDGGMIDITGSTSLSGGVLWTPAGVMQSRGRLTLSNIVIDGNLELLGGSETIYTGATLVVDDVVLINSNSSAALTELRFTQPTTLEGGGDLRLLGDGNGAMVTSIGGATVTVSAGNRIIGRGRIVAPLANFDDVAAEGGTLTLDTTPKVNNAVMRATTGATLVVSGVAITQGAGGQIRNEGGSVSFSHATSITGGRVVTVSGQTQASGVFDVTDTQFEGNLRLLGGSVTTYSGSALSFTGEVAVNPDAPASSTELRFTQPTTLTGGGALSLFAEGDGARVTSVGGAQVTNSAANSIRGRGRLIAPLRNQGEIVATGGALTFEAGAKVNNGQVRVLPGGALNVMGVIVTQGVAGAIRALGGTVDISGTCVLDGGTLENAFGAVINRGSLTLRGVRIIGALSLLGGASTRAELGVVNDGSILVNSNGSGLSSRLSITTPTTVQGTGSIHLGAAGSAAILEALGSNTLTLGPGQTLSGQGRLIGAIRAEGSIIPGPGIGHLEHNPGALTLGPNAIVEIQLAGPAIGQFDRITVQGPATVDGYLIVTPTAYSPPACASFRVLTATGGVSGGFRGVVGASPIPGYSWRAAIGSNSIDVVLACAGDFNADCQLDIFDFLAFQNAYALGSLDACDCDVSTGPGACDIFDFLCFQNAFTTGCP